MKYNMISLSEKISLIQCKTLNPKDETKARLKNCNLYLLFKFTKKFSA